MTATISNEEHIRLLKAERKLNALEAGGVDNWDNYEDSLTEFFAEAEFEEELEALIEDIVLAASENFDEPAGRGCGASVRAEGCTAIYELLKSKVKALKTDD